jgi:hypothetical protein
MVVEHSYSSSIQIHMMGIIQQEKILPCSESKDTSRVGCLQNFFMLSVAAPPFTSILYPRAVLLWQW